MSDSDGTPAVQGPAAPREITPRQVAPRQVAPRQVAPRRRKLRGWRLGVVAAAFLGVVGFLLAKGIGTSLDFYDTVPQALHDRAQLGSSTFRLSGVVVPGTIRRVPGGIDFEIEGGGLREPVEAHDLPSPIFQPGIGVVLVGHFAGNSFWTNQIMVKHSATYTPAKQAVRSVPAKQAVRSVPAKQAVRPVRAGSPKR